MRVIFYGSRKVNFVDIQGKKVGGLSNTVRLCVGGPDIRLMQVNDTGILVFGIPLYAEIFISYILPP